VRPTGECSGLVPLVLLSWLHCVVVASPRWRGVGDYASFKDQDEVRGEGEGECACEYEGECE